MVTWIRFHDKKTKHEFYFWNTHFDHRVQPAREKSALLVNKKVAELKTELPIILVGDFNASAKMNKTYDILVDDGGFEDTLLTAKKTINAEWNTINGFRQTRKGSRRIDWVLSKGGKTLEAEIVLFDNSKQYPSDHQPVSATIVLGK